MKFFLCVCYIAPSSLFYFSSVRSILASYRMWKLTPFSFDSCGRTSSFFFILYLKMHWNLASKEALCTFYDLRPAQYRNDFPQNRFKQSNLRSRIPIKWHLFSSALNVAEFNKTSTSSKMYSSRSLGRTKEPINVGNDAREDNQNNLGIKNMKFNGCLSVETIFMQKLLQCNFIVTLTSAVGQQNPLYRDMYL